MSSSEVDEAIACPFILPEKSKKRYELSYKTFKDWCQTKNIFVLSETLLLDYFLEKSTTMKSPASLWCEYSMLKTTILINENTDISKYGKLREFLKKKNHGYKPKKSNVFTKKEMNQFLIEAPDDTYLLMKVVMIMGVVGACRCNELCEMKAENVCEEGNVLIINIPDSKHGMTRRFTITSDSFENNVCYFTIIKKYINVRSKIKNPRFFIRYQGGKCYNQPVGKNTFSEMACKIAKYLNLANPETYTGHSFRKTTAALLANTGVFAVTQGGWVSSNIVESYVANSLTNKNDFKDKICFSKNDSEVGETSNQCKEEIFSEANEFSDTDDKNIEISLKDNKNPSVVNNISNCSNCNITINIKY